MPKNASKSVMLFSSSKRTNRKTRLNDFVLFYLQIVRNKSNILRPSFRTTMVLHDACIFWEMVHIVKVTSRHDMNVIMLPPCAQRVSLQHACYRSFRRMSSRGWNYNFMQPLCDRKNIVVKILLVRWHMWNEFLQEGRRTSCYKSIETWFDILHFKSWSLHPNERVNCKSEGWELRINEFKIFIILWCYFGRRKWWYSTKIIPE